MSTRIWTIESLSGRSRQKDGAHSWPPIRSDLTRNPLAPSTGSDAATLAADEICRGDEDRLQRLSNSPTSDGVIRLLIELRCEKLRPQLVSLAKGLDDKARAPADAAQDAPTGVLPGPVVSSPPLPPPRSLANEPSKRLRSTLSSRGVEPKRNATRGAAPNLPPVPL